MSKERMKPLTMTAIACLMVAGVLASAAGAQETAKPQPAKVEEKAPDKVEEGKPSEQAQENADNSTTMPDYRDDRSTPQALIESYYNAVNRREYARAYGYYSEEGREPEFSNFMKGYENTKSVRIALRKTEPDPGAGQIFWSQPIAIEAETTDGKKEVFSGCYTIRLTNPQMQEEPPYRPMEIMTGSLTKSPLELEKSVPEACEAP